MKDVREECEQRTNPYVPFDSLPRLSLAQNLDFSPPFTPDASGTSSTSESTSFSLSLSNPNAGLRLKKGPIFCEYNLLKLEI
jgi:hypothetical protein